MGFRNAWTALFSSSQTEEKASAAGAAISAFNVGQPVYTPRRFDLMAKEGYGKCAVAFRCIREIAGGIASIPMVLKSGDTEIEDHPLLTLLKNPNTKQGGASFFETMIVSHLIAGNSYMEAQRPGLAAANVKPGRRPPTELWVLRPDRMKIVAGRAGLPQAYVYEANGAKVTYEADPITGWSDTVMHFADPNPTDDWYGMSVINVAAASVDQWNSYNDYNVALMQNQCRPSGALIFRPILDRMSGKMESAPQSAIDSAEKKLRETHSGSGNAGKPMVLGGDVSWMQIGLSPAEMGYIEGKLSSARDICTAFGVPFVLIVTGDSTYNNRADARLELWEQTILPLADRLVDRLNNWLVPQYGEGGNLRLEMDLDEIPSLEPRRFAKWDRAINGFEKGVLTREEAREAMGYAPEAKGTFLEPRSPAGALSDGEGSPVKPAADIAKVLGDDTEEKVGRVLSTRNERMLLDARDAVRTADSKINEVVRQVQSQPVKKVAEYENGTGQLED